MVLSNPLTAGKHDAHADRMIVTRRCQSMKTKMDDSYFIAIATVGAEAQKSVKPLVLM
jgi:hypothetical protein